MADSNRVPTMQEWLALTEEERRRQVDSWNPYIGEGKALLDEIVERLRRELSQFCGVKRHGADTREKRRTCVAGALSITPFEGMPRQTNRYGISIVPG